MTQSLDFIYHQQMLGLTQNPVFFVDNPQALKHCVCLSNPMCGDALCFGYHNSKTHSKIYWHGEGCLICLASAEALCQTLIEFNQTQEIIKICTKIQDYFNGNDTITTEILPVNFLPLSCVKQVKSRIKCAILSTQCVIKLITSL